MPLLEIVALRKMNIIYPFLDSLFLIFFVILLIINKDTRALIWGLFGGILYFAVDYGIFHLWLGTRYIENASMFWVLLWMSLSYGITNFVWIWLWFDKGKNLLAYSLIIFFWWICCPLISSSFGTPSESFTIWRTTSSYHGVMAILLFVSYAILLVRNMLVNDSKKVNILWLLSIGILVQFTWEFSLLITGIRSVGFEPFQIIQTIVINSLMETNWGIPAMFWIYVVVNRVLDKRKERQLL